MKEATQPPMPMKEATRPPMPMAPPVPAPAPVPEAAPVAEAAKPAFKLGLKAKTATAAQPVAPAPGPAPAAVGPAVPVPPPAGAEAPVLNAPPPPAFVETDRGEEGEPAEITIMRKASTAPFTPPSKFPPPPGLKKAMQDAGAQLGKGGSGKAKLPKKKLILMVGGGIAALVLLGGVFVVYQKLTAPPPPPPPKPKIVAKPVPKPVAALVEEAKQQAEAPVNEVMGADPTAKPAETKPAETKSTETKTAETKPAGTKPTETAAAVAATPAPKPAEEVKPATPPPPPAPSVAFRGWVENLKISGVRGGANPRVFVGKSSYLKGDLVNPQLGITFEEYNDQTRVLIFKDKTGARVERRN